jgi:hypothetical protein
VRVRVCVYVCVYVCVHVHVFISGEFVQKLTICSV